MIFSASTFKWVGTLDALATAGCRVVALDLPSYSGQFASDDVKRRLLGDFLAQIGWHRKVVVVAASMGGTVGSPYVLSAGPDKVAGYVSVSALLPVEVASQVPTLLIWGENDSPTSTKAKAHQRSFANHQMVIIPDAPHPAYLKEPTLFNELLVQFATSQVKSSQVTAGSSLTSSSSSTQPNSQPAIMMPSGGGGGVRLALAAEWRGAVSKHRLNEASEL